MKKFKSIPKFKSEAQETEFWIKNDSTEFVDWRQAKVEQYQGQALLFGFSDSKSQKTKPDPRVTHAMCGLWCNV